MGAASVITDWVAGKLGYAKPQRVSTGFAAAQISRITASLASETEFINTTLRHQLRILRARSRQAAQNNPYARRFFQMVVDNVCGPQPFRLQSKAKFQNGDLDVKANAQIEAEWKDWGRAGVCEISGRWSWNTLQRLAVRNLAVDGEMLMRVYRGPEYGAHAYTLQLLDIDRLDDLLNKALPGGGAIHMGVEVDPVGKPVAYHLLKRKPSNWQSGYTPRESERVPADEIRHLFVPDFAEQVRGVPWIYAAMLQLVHEGAFEEAAVIAARVGAAQMGFIQSKDGGKTLAEAGIDGKDEKGNPQIDADPGTFPMLPEGYTVQGWNPKYPDAAVGPFIKACLRGIAAGVGVAYHNLAGDMESVNYSSARVAELDERDAWLAIQGFTVEHLHEPMYPDWLRMQVLAGRLPFQLDRLDKYRAIYWQARRWAWVDPEKEVNASVTAINNRLKSRTRIIAEGGEDIEDVLDEIAAEEQLAKKMKVELPPVEGKTPAAAPAASADAGAKALEGLRAEVKTLASRPTAPPVINTTVNMPEQKAPVVNTTVNVPEQKEPVINTTVNVPEQKAPVINTTVNVPEQKAPDVVVNVEVPDEIKIASMPTRESTSTTERNSAGEITKVTQTEKDAGK